MLDKFEVKKLAEYALNAFENSMLEDYRRMEVIDFFEKRGAKIFNIDFKKYDLEPLRKMSRRDDFEEDKVYEERSKIIIKELKNICKKSVPESDIQRILSYIQDALDLSDTDTEVYGVSMRSALFSDASCFFRFFTDYSRASSLAETFLNVSQEEIRSASKTLEKYNLIESHFGRYESEITDFSQNIFESRPKNKEEFEKFFLGIPLKGSLKWSDFNHIPCIDNIAKIISHAIKNNVSGVNILLYGIPGTGKTEFVKTLASKIKTNMYAIAENLENQDSRRFRDEKTSRYGKILFSQQIMRNSSNTCFLFDEAEDIFYGELKYLSKIKVNRLLETNKIPMIWTTNMVMEDPAFARRFTYSYQFEQPDSDVRTRMWQKSLKENGLPANKKIAEDYSKRFNVPPAFIANAAKTAKLAKGGLDLVEETLESMEKLCGIKKEKQEIKPVKDFNADLLNTSIDLKQLAGRIKKMNLKRFSLCLYGAPGTGKSAFALWLAKELKMPVIHKKCSDLKSPYVGMTEKNIAKAFDEAKKKGALLIFDEADSFLHNRENSRTSWETSEVNEMLTQMENATFPFVCTTNLMDSLDKAALRRFTFKVGYKFMTSEQKTKAFEYFFKMKDVDLSDLQDLSPADFELTYRKADILGILDNKDEIINLLRDEQKENPESKFKMGFH